MQVSGAQPVLSRPTCAERTGVSVLGAKRQLTPSGDRGVIPSTDTEITALTLPRSAAEGAAEGYQGWMRAPVMTSGAGEARREGAEDLQVSKPPWLQTGSLSLREKRGVKGRGEMGEEGKERAGRREVDKGSGGGGI
ncbi:unnamed protein product [Pleuronectes platessa]|uniref:Uncharacterized protein n=1 Tax=Pleuronectes platessa TaxID=8262 RepID=A0A9N7VEG3_PLEPL|nr:unnamed protein product [Pleuronectes platessa]